MYHYIYNNIEYNTWNEIIFLPEFKNVSLPYTDESLTDEELSKLGIARIPYTPKPPELDNLKINKIMLLQNSRDRNEYQNISTDKGLFDADINSRTRINDAMNSLSDTESRYWTTANGIQVTMTKQDFKNIISALAIRSDKCFAQYQELKTLVNACTTAEEVEKISWKEI